jgi:hypothetical protein
MLCHSLRQRRHRVETPAMLDADPWGEELQMALHLCYGLHYDGFEGVEDGWEWEPSLLDLRSRLEARFLGALVASTPQAVRPGTAVNGRDALFQVRRLLSEAEGPPLSKHVAEWGTLDNVREFVVHRSIYQRKEADPHTWAIPRLRGRAKSALVTLQSDEYGNGVAGRSHAELFASTMVSLDLDPAPGAYIDLVPAATLATDNLISLLGLQRRWRGALVGHLAAFEMTSVLPMSRYVAALRRLALPSEAIEFYEVHVEADLAHARIAADDLIMGLADSDPAAIGDVPFGVATLLETEARFASHLLACWGRGEPSLGSRPPVPSPTFAPASPARPLVPFCPPSSIDGEGPFTSN